MITRQKSNRNKTLIVFYGGWWRSAQQDLIYHNISALILFNLHKSGLCTSVPQRLWMGVCLSCAQGVTWSPGCKFSVHHLWSWEMLLAEQVMLMLWVYVATGLRWNVIIQVWTCLSCKGLTFMSFVKMW